MSATKTVVLLHLNDGSPKWWAGNPLTGDIAWGSVGALQTRKKDAAYVHSKSGEKIREGYLIVADTLDARLTMREISDALRPCRTVASTRIEAACRQALSALEKGMPASAPAVATPAPTLPGRERRCKVGKATIETLENDAWF